MVTKQHANCACAPRACLGCWKGREDMMRRTTSAACALGFAAALAATAAFGQDIPAGCSSDLKPKRAILSYAPERNGPRHLIAACLRDSEEIGIYSTCFGKS